MTRKARGWIANPDYAGSTPVTYSKFCPHSIMDNTLVYEAGDCGSIPYVGTKFNAALAEWLGTVLIRRLEREHRFNSYRQHQF